ncbi:hypothetical protein OS493_017594 [Desmophyllum pertusum]|uniref:Uncharacterized protein n=1 Tax=Desmophyllum pertusum TaxID=174260 RepID=A0A9X0D377_9CNID|nr:hypothetical protein OS493_017594 [Desmophyllum pertusum]
MSPTETTSTRHNTESILMSQLQKNSVGGPHTIIAALPEPWHFTLPRCQGPTPSVPASSASTVSAASTVPAASTFPASAASTVPVSVVSTVQAVSTVPVSAALTVSAASTVPATALALPCAKNSNAQIGLDCN